MEPNSSSDELGDLVAAQIAYYRAYADEYDQTSVFGDSFYQADYAELMAALNAFEPAGRVLELACGTGQWTAELAKRASSVTALDSSSEMLAINKAKLSQDNVRYVEADLFRWSPAERYDVVFFCAWLSHVPPQLFDRFWQLVRGCLNDTGRVFVIDELPAVDATERRAPGTAAPAVERPLRSGERRRIIKVFYEPLELRERLVRLDWEVEIRTVGWRFFYAIARPTGAEERLAAARPSALRSRRG